MQMSDVADETAETQMVAGDRLLELLYGSKSLGSNYTMLARRSMSLLPDQSSRGYHGPTFHYTPQWAAEPFGGMLRDENAKRIRTRVLWRDEAYAWRTCEALGHVWSPPRHGGDCSSHCYRCGENEC